MSTAWVAIIISSTVAIIAVFTAASKLALAIYRFLRRMDESLTYVESEMRCNGGSTMRDDIVKMKELTVRIDARVHELEDQSAGDARRVAESVTDDARFHLLDHRTDDAMGNVVRTGDLVQIAEPKVEKP